MFSATITIVAALAVRFVLKPMRQRFIAHANGELGANPSAAPARHAASPADQRST
jgi:hypothetical protein